MKELTVYYCTDLNSKYGELLFYPFGKKAMTVMDVDKEANILACPAFRDSYKNTFYFQSPKDMTITKNKEELSWFLPEVDKGRDFEYVSTAVYPRTNRTFSIRYMNILFWCEENLEIEQLHPSLVDSELAAKTEVVPGKFNISKWFREIDNAYQMRKDFESINIKRGEPLFFIRFHTDREIVFKRFSYTEEIQKLNKMCIKTKNVDSKFLSKIQNYYDLFLGQDMNKRVTKAVKEALL